MNNTNKNSISACLGLITFGLMAISMMVSCGKSDVNPTDSRANAQLQIVNLSPDLEAFNLFGTYTRFNTNRYSYPSPSGYFLIPTADTPLQIRAIPVVGSSTSLINILTLDKRLDAHVKYTWFVTGLEADSSLVSVVTVDTGATPPPGRAKIRFMNASPTATTLNVAANDTIAFSKVGYKQVTDYREITAGNYTIKLTATSNPRNILRSLSITALDGKLYTLYGYGLINRSDTTAFGAGVILNTVPETSIR